MPETTFEEAIAACTTSADIWSCWSQWPNAAEASPRVVARSARVWDQGLVWHLVFGAFSTYRDALSNPTWPQWGDALVGERAAAILSVQFTQRGPTIAQTDISTAYSVLLMLSEAGRLPQGSDTFERLIGALDGRSKPMVERHRDIVNVLSSGPNVSREVFEHLFTAARRGNALDRSQVTQLLRSPYMTDVHWSAVLDSDLREQVSRLAGLFPNGSTLPQPIREFFLSVVHLSRESVVVPLLSDLSVRTDPVLAPRVLRAFMEKGASWVFESADRWATLAESGKALIRQVAATQTTFGQALAKKLLEVEPAALDTGAVDVGPAPGSADAAAPGRGL